MEEKQSEKCTSLLVHGIMLDETFKVPPNIRIISYNCPDTLYWPPAPIFHILNTGAHKMEDIANAFAYYPLISFDFGVHKAGEQINNIIISYNIMDPCWKLGYFSSKNREYQPVKMDKLSFLKDFMKLNYDEAITVVRNPTYLDENVGYNNNSYLLGMQKTMLKLDDVIRRISDMAGDLSDNIINIILWTCKTDAQDVGNRFMKGTPINYFLSDYGDVFGEELTDSDFKYPVYEISIDYDIHNLHSLKNTIMKQISIIIERESIDYYTINQFAISIENVRKRKRIDQFMDILKFSKVILEDKVVYILDYKRCTTKMFEEGDYGIDRLRLIDEFSESEIESVSSPIHRLDLNFIPRSPSQVFSPTYSPSQEFSPLFFSPPPFPPRRMSSPSLFSPPFSLGSSPRRITSPRIERKSEHIPSPRERTRRQRSKSR